jgi:hypothetical protein
MQRMVLIGTAVVAVTVLGLLVFAFLNESVIKPRRELITVGDNSITVSQFQERVLFDYYFQTGGQMAGQLSPEIDTTLVVQYLIDNMVNDLLIQHKAAELGISISDAQVQEEIELAFGYDAGDPEPTPTPRPTEAELGEPTVTPTFVFTPTPRPTATLESGITPTATQQPSPTPEEPDATPTSAVTAVPPPTATPVTEEWFETSFNNFIEATSQATGLSQERVIELFYQRSRTMMLREQIMTELDLEVDETVSMVHAAHILVATQEEAQAALDRLNSGEEFEVVAAFFSLDTSNAYKGGNLGWFGRGQMVAPFEEAVFALPVGEISDPVETDFGWHIIKKYDEEVIPATAAQQEEQRLSLFNELLVQWRDEAEVVVDEAWVNFIPDLLP